MKILLFFAAIACSSMLFAGAGSPVQHTHGDRSHSHPLPESGRNHTHNGKKPQSSNTAGKGWTNYSGSSSGWSDFKDGSYQERKNKAGLEIGTLIIKYRYKGKDSAYLNKIYVTKKDCLAGYGTIIYLKLNGEYETEISFAEGAGLVSSSTARVVCQFFKADAEKSL